MSKQEINEIKEVVPSLIFEWRGLRVVACSLEQAIEEVIALKRFHGIK